MSGAVIIICSVKAQFDRVVNICVFVMLIIIKFTSNWCLG